MGAAGWVVNWWLGAIPRMNSVTAFLGNLGRKRPDSAPGMGEWKSNLRSNTALDDKDYCCYCCSCLCHGHARSLQHVDCVSETETVREALRPLSEASQAITDVVVARRAERKRFKKLAAILPLPNWPPAQLRLPVAPLVQAQHSPLRGLPGKR